MSMVFCDDCLQVLAGMADESVDLIYLDPPFFSQKVQTLTNSRGEKFSFADCWDSRGSYLEYMRLRLVALRRVLKRSGSLFLHCDSSASAYLRLLLDEIFGEQNFRSEIIWTYRRWSNSKKGLLSAHQTIYFYSKTESFKFNQQYMDYSAATNLDQILQQRTRLNGKAVYKTDDLGQIVQGAVKKGVPLSDVWDIPFLNPKARERTGYPTQKPLTLLDRIISIASDPGDVVLDPFCGSGTAVVSAMLSGRQGIGIDLNPEAVRITKERLDNPFKSESALLQKGRESYFVKKNPIYDCLKLFDCRLVQRNRGIDAILNQFYDGRPVALKVQRPDETFAEAVRLLSQAGRSRHCFCTVLISTEQGPVPTDMILFAPPGVLLARELQVRQVQPHELPHA